MLSTLPSTPTSSSAATQTSWLQGRAKLSNENTKSLCSRKPKVSLSLSYYLRSRIASSSEGAIFGPRPTSDSDSLPKLCPIGLDQTSKVKGTNLDKFLNIFQLKFVFCVSTSFAIFILKKKNLKWNFTCIKYLTLFKVYRRPKLGNN